MSDAGDDDQLWPDEPVADPAWVADVLGFWFALTQEQWFASDAAIDRQCEERFRDLHAQVAQMTAQDVTASAQKALAAVIVLDQFSRNIYRGTPQAFAHDGRARQFADAALKLEFDTWAGKDVRLFLYLPFEHSEYPADQARSVALFTALGDQFYLDFAIAHRDIISRFGRFPHRNAVLGRASTAEEIAFLAQPGSSF